MNSNGPGLILHNGHILRLDPEYHEVSDIALKDCIVVSVDDAKEYEHGPNTKVIDLNGRHVTPGLNGSHLHVIRAGLDHNTELCWKGVQSVGGAMRSRVALH